MTRFKGKLAGLPRETELSNIFPSVVHPVYCTVTMSSAAGCCVPVPGVSTLDARPEAVFTASAGGAATSGGGGITWSVTVPDWANAAAIAAAKNTIAVIILIRLLENGTRVRAASWSKPDILEQVYRFYALFLLLATQNGE